MIFSFLNKLPRLEGATEGPRFIRFRLREIKALRNDARNISHPRAPMCGFPQRRQTTQTRCTESLDLKNKVYRVNQGSPLANWKFKNK
jgi:hypothetical protein